MTVEQRERRLRTIAAASGLAGIEPVCSGSTSSAPFGLSGSAKSAMLEILAGLFVAACGPVR